eukprot:1056843-Pelagomonas_calceolata.AAC.2
MRLVCKVTLLSLSRFLNCVYGAYIRCQHAEQLQPSGWIRDLNRVIVGGSPWEGCSKTAAGRLAESWLQVENADTIKLNNLAAAECNLIRLLFKGSLDHFYELTKVSLLLSFCEADGINANHLPIALPLGHTSQIARQKDPGEPYAKRPQIMLGLLSAHMFNQLAHLLTVVVAERQGMEGGLVGKCLSVGAPLSHDQGYSMTSHVHFKSLQLRERACLSLLPQDAACIIEAKCLLNRSGWMLSCCSSMYPTANASRLGFGKIVLDGTLLSPPRVYVTKLWWFFVFCAGCCKWAAGKGILTWQLHASNVSMAPTLSMRLDSA